MKKIFLQSGIQILREEIFDEIIFFVNNNEQPGKIGTSEKD